MLLEHTVGNLDPLYIVNMVPNGIEIPRLVSISVIIRFQHLSCLYLLSIACGMYPCKIYCASRSLV